MNDLNKKITIVFISYKSKKKIIPFVEHIFKDYNIIIIENSDERSIKSEITNNKCIIYFVKNLGYGSSINYARKNINTEYFIVINPDILDIDYFDIKKFYDTAKQLKNSFSCLGPRYTNISSKTLKQSNINKEIETIKSISGAVMFFNIKKFDLLNGFDKNFFLYFEETDYCYRGNKVGLKSYQINSIKVKHMVGTSVNYKDEYEQNKIKELLTWHFIWSKFYFFRKHYGFLFSIIYFFPILIRSIVKFLYFQLTSNNKKKRKYLIRLDGLLNSIVGNKSYKRIKN